MRFVQKAGDIAALAMHNSPRPNKNSGVDPVREHEATKCVQQQLAWPWY
jgi:hypothetical protein